MAQSEKRLYRSRSNRLVAGVCSGLGEFFGIDTTLVRLAFVLGVIFGFGSLLVVYIVMMFVVPEEPLTATPVEPQPLADESETPTEEK